MTMRTAGLFVAVAAIINGVMATDGSAQGAPPDQTEAQPADSNDGRDKKDKRNRRDEGARGEQRGGDQRRPRNDGAQQQKPNGSPPPQQRQAAPPPPAAQPGVTKPKPVQEMRDPRRDRIDAQREERRLRTGKQVSPPANEGQRGRGPVVNGQPLNRRVQSGPFDSIPTPNRRVQSGPFDSIPTPNRPVQSGPFDSRSTPDVNNRNNQRPGQPAVNTSPRDRAPPVRDAARPFQPKPTPPVAAGSVQKLDDVKRDRVRRVEDGGNRVVIQEPDKRVIVRQGNRMVIQRDDTQRVRRVAPNARFERENGGNTLSIVDRPNGVKIYSETDSNGQLIRRYRRDASGRDTTIVDNRYAGDRRRRKNSFGKNVAIGAGIGIGVLAGAAILNSMVDVPPPRVGIPRDRYIVGYEGASEEEIYDTLSAPPVDNYSDRYTLNEIRATARLRDRMRRIDLNDITFAFGSWDIDPSQYGKLERIAHAMMRVIDRNPNEVFLIEGYTDAVGSREDNLTLSDRRAESVAVILTQQFDVPFENLTTQGYGEDYLKVQTLAPERLNRRVAVRRITPLLAHSDRAGPRGDDRDYDRGGYDDRRGDGRGYDDNRGADDRGADDGRNYRDDGRDDGRDDRYDDRDRR